MSFKFITLRNKVELENKSYTIQKISGMVKPNTDIIDMYR